MNNGTSSYAEKLINSEAEQGLLGMIMAENTRLWDCHDLLKPEDFAYPIHGEIFGFIVDLIGRGKAATPVTLKQQFESHEDLRDLGGMGYLVDLHANSSMINTARDYAMIIADLAERRRMMDAITQAQSKILHDTRQAHEIAAEITGELSRETAGGTNVRTKREVAMAAADAISLPPDCFETGLIPLDRTMGGGLYAGFTYGLAGAEKRGKTTLAHTISHNLNENGVLHAYIALEMGSLQIEQRNLARMMEINSLKFLQPGTRNDGQLLSRLTMAISNVKDSTLYLDMPGATLENLQIELSRLVMKHKIKGFILDYWQLVEGQAKNETEERHLRRVAQWVANFARKHKIWCILLSQVNDEGKLFAGKGLVKACDQLYTIELAETGSDQQEIWLRMSHSRYTPLADVGTAQNPLLFVNKKSGPFVDEIYRQAPQESRLF